MENKIFILIFSIIVLGNTRLYKPTFESIKKEAYKQLLQGRTPFEATSGIDIDA
jgi:hypothetical protein